MAAEAEAEVKSGEFCDDGEIHSNPGRYLEELQITNASR